MNNVSIRPAYVRHAWPEKPGLSIYRPNGVAEYTFLHLWNPFEIRLNGETVKTKPHACIIFRKGSPMIYGSVEASTQDWFRLSGDVEGFLAHYGLACDTIYYPKNCDFITTLTRKLEIEDTVKNSYHQELSYAILQDFFIRFSRAISPDNQTDVNVNRQTIEQLKTLRLQLSLEYDKKWSISDMAKFINLSESYLFASYKKYYGISPMQDLISIRIQRAKTLLLDHDYSIKEISEMLGYPNPSHFIRQFTKSEGHSPLKCRQSNVITERNKMKRKVHPMKHPHITKTELIIHPHELTDRWIELAKELKLSRVSLHPFGGAIAHESLVELIDTLKDPVYRAKIDKLAEADIEIGYEFHALTYLLPRELFKTHPEYFRINHKDERTSYGNFCFSNKEARELICKNAVKLAKELYRSCNEYYFWLDDATNLGCHCEECKKHSFAHHQLSFMNQLVGELRREIPDAKVCYLAYYEGVAIPEDITPAEGVFLEYAPFERYIKPDSFAFDDEYLKIVKGLVEFFGKKDSKVLEYWYDNSIYFRRAGNKLVPFNPNNEQIKADFIFYRDLGFERLSSFACNLCDEYVELFGEPDLSAIKYREC